MTTVLDLRAGTLGELVAAVRTISDTWTPGVVQPQELWFRGQKRRDFSLTPGLYRSRNVRYHYDEVGLFERFKSLAAPHASTSLQTDWDWYFCAQHFGLPTRLLDWTENLLAAAYFAVCEGIYCGDRLAIDDDLVRGRQPARFDDDCPVVWVMDAGTVNQAACGEDRVFVAGREYTSRYLPEGVAVKVAENLKPLALLAPRTNLRITAQQGTFTVHGHDRIGLEVSGPAAGVQLARVTLDGANLSFFWEELQLCGMSKHALFPGIDTAAEHAAWLMQSAEPAS